MPGKEGSNEQSLLNIQAGPKVPIEGDDPEEFQAMPDDDNLVLCMVERLLY